MQLPIDSSVPACTMAARAKPTPGPECQCTGRTRLESSPLSMSPKHLEEGQSSNLDFTRPAAGRPGRHHTNCLNLAIANPAIS